MEAKIKEILKRPDITPTDVILDVLRATLGPDRQEEIKLKELDDFRNGKFYTIRRIKYGRKSINSKR